MNVNYYERLAPLQVADKSVSLRGGLKKGDCVISFSRKDILAIKGDVEKRGLRCAVVYGALPPETRAGQANLFNNLDSGIDVLVASDAIGMGLNLNIQRIIFSSVKKFDGTALRHLNHSEIKQIAGRAGRFNSAYESGVVSSTERAGLFPQEDQLEMFAKLTKPKSFSSLLDEFFEYTDLDNIYFLENTEQKLEIAKYIDHVIMPIKDKYQFMMAPIKNTGDSQSLAVKVFKRYAERFASGRSIPLLINKPYCNGDSYDMLHQYLKELEECYSIADMYLWLSQKYPDRFTEHKAAQELSNETNQKITTTLLKLGDIRLSFIL
eukprot:gene10711-12458_t